MAHGGNHSKKGGRPKCKIEARQVWVLRARSPKANPASQSSTGRPESRQPPTGLHDEAQKEMHQQRV
jgi:hypothetical protein